ncbi:hypothetical protein MAMMFC1_01784 [Methylomusa anaerophila]|uniref:Uncharacterized protein n=2 Tax=Methylomusa anaerophila TaxID=1930071 RepID=A0A348AJ67_9FIRM|nr:hypothetical protein MAMMFC1_01784 [Methylomusa anaerophila]
MAMSLSNLHHFILGKITILVVLSLLTVCLLNPLEAAAGNGSAVEGGRIAADLPVSGTARQKSEAAVNVLTQSISLFRTEGKNVLDDITRQMEQDETVGGQSAENLRQAVAESANSYNAALTKLENRLNKIKSMQAGMTDEGKTMVNLLAEINGSANDLEQGLNGMLDKVGEAYQRAYSLSAAAGATQRAEFSKKVVLDKFADAFRQLRELKQSITELLLEIVEQERQIYRQKNIQGIPPKVKEVLELWSQADESPGLGFDNDKFSLSLLNTPVAITSSWKPLQMPAQEQLGNYSYTGWGGWTNPALANNNTVNNNAVQNQAAVLKNIVTITPANEIPAQGTATYSGTIAGSFHDGGVTGNLTGSVSLTAFFANRMLSGNYSLNTSSGSVWTNGSLRGSWTVGGTAVNGTIRSANGMNGTVAGAFHGNDAAQFNGNWSMNGAGKTADGAFGASKQ